MNNHEEPKQLWMVANDNGQWLWYGRGSQADALEGAKGSRRYDLEATLYLFAVSAEIVIKPEAMPTAATL